MKKNIMVSICCITYNQEKYIRQTLDSFLNQKTDFDYEIVIHDDASTDETINIIKEYQNKYPDIIKPIFEEENQHSKKVKIFPLVFKEASGKYIALCEGDDYWIDDYKLQKQFDFMEKNQDCSLITTGVKLYDESNDKYMIKMASNESRFYTTEEVIIGDGDLFSTNTMFFKSKYVKPLPNSYYVAPVGDYPIAIHLSLCGKVYYLNEITAVYRLNAKGSWSVRMADGDVLKKKMNLYSGLIKMFDEINKESNYKYMETINYFLLKKEFNILFSLNQIKAFKNDKFKKLYKTGNTKSKIKYFLKIKFPFLCYLLKK